MVLPATVPSALASPWRHLFPLTQEPEVLYLNGAGEGPHCAVTDRASAQVQRERERPWIKEPTDCFTVMARVRECGARLIGADPAGAAFVPSCGHGMNILATGYPWEPGDRVLLFAGEFPSSVYPFLNLQRRGVTVDFCPAIEGIPDYTQLAALVTSRTRMIVTSWVQFFNGFTHDLALLKSHAERVGALLCIDATQGVGLWPLDVTALGVDAATFSGHKTLCAPVGTGIFWLDPRHAERIQPSACGWIAQMPGTDFGDLTAYAMREGLDGRRFEVGSDAQIVLRPFLALMEWFLEVGSQTLSAHVGALIAELAAGFAARHCPVVPDPAHRSWILSVQAPNPTDTPAFHQGLWDAGVISSLREGRIRLSPHCFNDGSDITRFFERLDRILASAG